MEPVSYTHLDVYKRQVYALMDNDFFNQAVKGGGVQFRDVGVFLNGFYPLAGVIRKPDSVSYTHLDVYKRQGQYPL